MIRGVHALIYAQEADKVRAFFRDVLELPSVDAGDGWLIFALPPAEVGVHPLEEDDEPHHALYLMCDDIGATIAELAAKGVRCSEVREMDWGSAAMVELPDGGSIGMYQPKHPTAIPWPSTSRREGSQ